MTSTPKPEPITRLSSEQARRRLVRGESATDWSRADAIADEALGADDPDALPLTDAELKAAPIVRRPGQRGPQKTPTKQRTTLRLAPEVLAHFRAEGAGWQTRINEALRQWIAEHGKH